MVVFVSYICCVLVVDIDECAANPCGVPSVAVSCSNTAGGYSCNCQPGYEFVNSVTCTGESLNMTATLTRHVADLGESGN